MFTSVVIDNLNIFCASARPAKTNAPLIVNTNAALTSTFAFEKFKAVARRHFQIIQSPGDFELPQFSARYCSYVRKPLDTHTIRQAFGVGAFE